MKRLLLAPLVLACMAAIASAASLDVTYSGMTGDGLNVFSHPPATQLADLDPAALPPRDQALLVNALGKLGDFVAAASAAAEMKAAHVAGATGSAETVWALVHHYRLTRDDAWLTRQRDYLADFLAAAPVLGATEADANTIFWQIAGLREAVYAMQVLGQPALTNTAIERYCNQRDGFFASLRDHRGETGIQYIPLNLSADEDADLPLDGLWPTRCLHPLDPLTRLHYLEALNGRYGREDHYALQHNLFLLKDLDSISLSATAMRINWLPLSEFLMLRDECFFEQDDMLVLSHTWNHRLNPGRTLSMEGPTYFGELDAVVRASTGTLELDFRQALNDECSLVEWWLPGDRTPRRVLVDGREHELSRGNAVRFLPRPCTVRVEY